MVYCRTAYQPAAHHMAHLDTEHNNTLHHHMAHSHTACHQIFRLEWHTIVTMTHHHMTHSHTEHHRMAYYHIAHLHVDGGGVVMKVQRSNGNSQMQGREGNNYRFEVSPANCMALINIIFFRIRTVFPTFCMC